MRYIFILMLVVSILGCRKFEDVFIKRNLKFVSIQLNAALSDSPDSSLIPYTAIDGELLHCTVDCNTSGFFAGSLWYMFELTGDQHWATNAKRFTESLAPMQYYAKSHDSGVMLFSSYGNAFRLTNSEAYKQVLINGAELLYTRFNKTMGSIKSWDDGNAMSGEKWQFPVSIGSLMNLDLLFYASKVSKNPKYREIAITHANTLLQNHFREDGSSCQVVDYDSITGIPLGQYTKQGLSNTSSWARGQAYGLYGYVLCFQETGDSNYLRMAEKIANYILTHPHLPFDHIPYWDFNAKDMENLPERNEKLHKFPNTPRDASAAAIMCSSLFKLSKLSLENKERFKDSAMWILASLSRDYKADKDKNKWFVLDHSVGDLPTNTEINVSLNYADYYYLEAMQCYRNY